MGVTLETKRGALGANVQIGPDGLITDAPARRAVGEAARLQSMLMRAPLNLCGFGNSITAAHSSFWKALAAKSVGKLVAGTNAGITGNTSAQMLARVATDVPDAASVVTVMEGSNDASAPATNPAHVANIRGCIENLLSRGKLPIIVAEPPRDSYTSTMEKYRLASLALAREYKLPYVDPWRGQFKTDGTGSWSTTYSTDGIHPTTSGQTLGGETAHGQLLGTTSSVLLPTSNAPSRGLISSNALMLTDTNADGTPDNWSSASSGTTATKALASAGLGNWFSIELTGATATGAGQGHYANINRAFTTGFSAGDTLLWVGRLKTESFSNAQVKLYLVSTGGATTEHIVHQYLIDNVEHEFQLEFVVPTGTTTITLYALLAGAAAGTFDGKVSIAQNQIWNMTTAYAA